MSTSDRADMRARRSFVPFLHQIAAVIEPLEPRLMLSGDVAVLQQADEDYSDVALRLPGYVVEPDQTGDLQLQTVQSSSVINLDDFRADPRFAGIDGSGYSIAILDTGIDLDHPFFGPDADFNGVADRIAYQYDFADGDADASDVNGHGSNVASITASQDPTYTGMAPGADLIILKVFGDSGGGDFGMVESALQWVVANAAAYNIVSINMSLGDGGNYTSPISLYGLGDELADLTAAGVMTVVAAGNDFYEHSSAQGVSYPAADPNCVAVSAVWDANNGGPYYWSGGAIDYTTGTDRLVSFSQRHATMTDISAPGAMITGANTSGGTSSYAGTSQASPHIAGIAALAQQLAEQALGRRLTLAEFRDVLEASGQTIHDGDDEDDNVVNTGLDLPRVDVLAMGEAILALGDPGSISGMVWLDKDSDGLPDAGEPGMAGWTVFLDADDDGELDPGEEYRVTDAGGAYEFSDLPAGSYDVWEVLATGFTQTSPLGEEYAAATVTPTFEDIRTTGNAILVGNDDVAYQLGSTNLGDFSFDFYGQNYTSLWVATNGLITFGLGESYWYNEDLSIAPDQAAIAPFWDDLVITGASDSAVYWQVLGSGNDERLVVQWNNVQFYNGGGLGLITFQAVLYEQDGAIQFNYLDLASSHSGAEGAWATVGIKDVGIGADRLQLCYNNGPNQYVQTGVSTRIVAGGQGNHQVAVIGGAVDGVDFGNWAPCSIEGDFNADEGVSGADYVVWANNFGGSDTVLAVGSHNHDGVVSGSEYVIWADHFGDVAGAQLATAATATAGQLAAVQEVSSAQLSRAELRAARRAHRQFARVAQALENGGSLEDCPVAWRVARTTGVSIDEIDKLVDLLDSSV